MTAPQMVVWIAQMMQVKLLIFKLKNFFWQCYYLIVVLVTGVVVYQELYKYDSEIFCFLKGGWTVFLSFLHPEKSVITKVPKMYSGKNVIKGETSWG